MPDELRKSKKRAIRYFYEDGSLEFSLGLLSFILAIFFLFISKSQGWLQMLAEVSLILVIIAGAGIINWFIRKLKQNITWPRTGYISYRHIVGRNRGWRIGLGMIIGGLVAALAVIISMSQVFVIASLPLLSGIMFCLVIGILGWRTSIIRFYLLASISCFLGVSLAFSGLSNNTSLILFYASMAGIFLLTGVCVLITYLHRNPYPGEKVDEG
jgi:hypothetical protein